MTPIVAARSAAAAAARCGSGGKWLPGKVQEMGLGCVAAPGWTGEDGGGHVHRAHERSIKTNPAAQAWE